MPAVNDVVQVKVTFHDASGGLFQNMFTILLTAVAVNDWQFVLTDVANWLILMHSNYMNNVSGQVGSDTIELSVRDIAAKEWNSVVQAPFNTLAGQSGATSTSAINCATVVAFPQLKRHWGFKNLPPPSVDAMDNGSLVGAVLIDLLVYGGAYASPYVGNDTDFSSGVLSLATETFRAFIGSFQATTVVGSRTTRKEGVGI